MTTKHKHKKKAPPKGFLRHLRNPVVQQKAADKYQKSIEMQTKFLDAQRAINNRIQHDRLAAGGVPAALLASKIHG